MYYQKGGRELDIRFKVIKARQDKTRVEAVPKS
jgi:hypothetical protein